jgi:hypothetical protein
VAVDAEALKQVAGSDGTHEHRDRRRLANYALLAGIFNAGFASVLVKADRDGKVPERIAAEDVLLVGIATHKLSRIITKESVTGFARAPFTRYKGRSGKGEVEEAPKGSGLRRAIGELLICPYCMDQWLAGAFTAGMLLAPRRTRVVASMFASLAISDGLQMAYVWGKHSTDH